MSKFDARSPSLTIKFAAGKCSLALVACALLLAACSERYYSLGSPDDSSGGVTGAGATAPGLAGSANAGSNAQTSGGASANGGSTNGSAANGGSANGSAANGGSTNGGSAGTSAGAANGGSSANGGAPIVGPGSGSGDPCSTDLDCGRGLACVFPIAGGCAAHASCQLKGVGSTCTSVAPYCGCSGKTVSVACDEPSGYSAVAVSGAGACANSPAPICGNGVTEPGEQCDDGALANGDGCSATCQIEALVVPGSYFTCAMSDKGVVKCWGRNEHGELGQGDTATRGGQPGQMGTSLNVVDLGSARHATSLVVGDSYACALLDDHSVKCWGENNYGQLGQGDTNDRGDQPGEMGDALPAIQLGTGRYALSIAAESVNVCAVLDDRSVACWGWDGGGELGIGEENPYQDAQCIGDQPGEMGDNLVPADLGSKRAVSVAAGSYHMCALFADGTVKCWGTNQTLGQLGLGDQEERGNWPPNLGDNLPVVDVGTGRTVKNVTAGNYHTCVILDNDTLKCWGANTDGQLGLGDTAERGGNPGEMGDNLPVVNLGTGRHATRIAVGVTYTCALLDDRSVKCWGDNTLGELGLGDTTARGGNPGDMGDNLPRVSLGTGRSTLAVTASKSGYGVCVELDDGSNKCWGDNEYAQLGLGSISLGLGSQPGQMGDALPVLDLGF